MIAVSVRKDGISVLGHSGYAPAGKDIVCAAVSTLVCTLVNSLDALTKDKIEYQISDGTGIIRYGDLSDAGKLLVDSFFIGVSAISEQYPKYIRIG